MIEKPEICVQRIEARSRRIKYRQEIWPHRNTDEDSVDIGQKRINELRCVR